MREDGEIIDPKIEKIAKAVLGYFKDRGEVWDEPDFVHLTANLLDCTYLDAEALARAIANALGE